MRVRIQKIGVSGPPTVVNAETGEPLKGVAGLQFKADVRGSHLFLWLVDFDIDVEHDVDTQPELNEIDPKKVEELRNKYRPILAQLKDPQISQTVHEQAEPGNHR